MRRDELEEKVMQCVADGDYEEAEGVLNDSAAKARLRNDVSTLGMIYGLLSHVYSMWDPPNIEGAVVAAREREALNPTAYNVYQTSMVLYWTAKRFEEAAKKARAAVAKAGQEDDRVTTYSALCLLGLASLKVGHLKSAADVLAELKHLFDAGQVGPVGDETLFLEELAAAGQETERVKNLATLLAPACRDPQFRARLVRLAQP